MICGLGHLLSCESSYFQFKDSFLEIICANMMHTDTHVYTEMLRNAKKKKKKKKRKKKKKKKKKKHENLYFCAKDKLFSLPYRRKGMVTVQLLCFYFSMKQALLKALATSSDATSYEPSVNYPGSTIRWIRVAYQAIGTVKDRHRYDLSKHQRQYANVARDSTC